ncbi:MAG: hypothetical protein M1834_009349 [Cirrosporium novae-zelandiae]|nr:MAG: hypothetical protein M1834_009349 [Cirrosporium novae-zelandiae]
MPSRQPSVSSSRSTETLHCITVDSTCEPASTPPTSVTDGSNASNDARSTASGDVEPPRRVLRARVSLGSYNENVLSGQTRSRTRVISGDTLVDEKESDGSGQHLEGEYSNSWNSQNISKNLAKATLPRSGSVSKSQFQEQLDDNDGDVQPAPIKREYSLRRSLSVKAGNAVDRAKTVLGKRARDVGINRYPLRDRTVDRRASLRPRNQNARSEPEPSFEGPVKKRLRLSEEAMLKKPTTPDTEVPPKPPPQTKVKRWLSQGLYVGQHRDFDPRKTESKNRRKSKAQGRSHERKILPLPIFGGERLLNLGRDFKLPFNVFSPLPPGQPKPEEWRKTQKNVFVGDAALLWRKDDNFKEYMSTCLCTEETGCDDDCQNRLMFYECDDMNCNLSPDNCGNRSFADLKRRCKKGGKFNIGVEVIKTVNRGYGVRSNRSFEPDQIIVEYTGEIITQEECDKRMNTLYKNKDCYYLMSFDQNMIIDATRGSIARFVNHSCEPNCRMEKWTVNGTPRMALFAGEQGIMTGEELTYDYNFDPFSVKNVQECRCGAPSCRGFLGPTPPTRESSKHKESKEKDHNHNHNASKTKRTTTPSSGKKRKLHDDPAPASKKRKTSSSVASRSVRSMITTTAARLSKRTKKVYTSSSSSSARKSSTATHNPPPGSSRPSSARLSTLRRTSTLSSHISNIITTAAVTSSHSTRANINTKTSASTSTSTPLSSSSSTTSSTDLNPTTDEKSIIVATETTVEAQIAAEMKADVEQHAPVESQRRKSLRVATAAVSGIKGVLRGVRGVVGGR